MPRSGHHEVIIVRGAGGLAPTGQRREQGVGDPGVDGEAGGAVGRRGALHVIERVCEFQHSTVGVPGGHR